MRLGPKARKTSAERLSQAWPGVVVLAVCALFWPALSHEPITGLADADYLFNPLFGRQWAQQARLIFGKIALFEHGGYQPIALATFAVQHAWASPLASYFAFNVIAHALTAALVCLLASALYALAEPRSGEARRLVCAAFAALIFAGHPLRVEPVAWLGEGRAYPLAAFFFVASVLAYIRSRPGQSAAKLWRLSSLALYAASLTSYCTALPAPAILLALDWYPLERTEKEGWRALIAEKVPYALLALTAFAADFAGRLSKGFVIGLQDFGWWDRAACCVYTLSAYVERTLVPSGLSPLVCRLPAGAFHRLADPTLARLIALCLAAALLWRRRSRWPAPAVAALCYACALVPVMGILRIDPEDFAAADRWSYLAAVFPAVLAGGLLLHVWEARRLKAFQALTLPAVIVALAFAATRRQLGYWKNEETLLRHSIAIDPACRPCRLELIRCLVRQNRWADSIRECRDALQIETAPTPDYERSINRWLELSRRIEASGS